VVAVRAGELTDPASPVPPEPATPEGYPVRLDGRIDPELDRWHWLVKWLLAIPHLLVLALLWTVTAVLTVVAWFAILLTGSYPRAIFDFSVGVLRWTWRVQFYAFNVLATDRYPPFSFDADPEYPADLSVDYPATLSRRLVLVKSWLLALPHLLIVVLIAGVPFWPWSDARWAAIGGGLLGLLTLVAMVVLVFSGRYPPAVFDLVMGLNRWVYRVLAYVLLMRDEYPPFRLDSGGTDPASVEVTPPAMLHEGGAVQPRTATDERRSGIRLTIVGTVLLAAGLAFWWLVESTNPSGDHDAQLLPIFALIPLLLGLFRLFHSHSRA
jgi:hypothetical protein